MEEFIEKHGTEILEELFDILNNKDDKYRYDECDDNLCDAEDCRLNKAFKMYLKYRQFITYTYCCKIVLMFYNLKEYELIFNGLNNKHYG